MSSRFWGFSLAVYSADAVQDECLALQDQFGLDINLVLFCTFIGAVRGVALTADDIAAVRQEVGPWHQDIVRSLRTARRHLKTVELRDAQVAEAATQLRTRVKAAELESEYVEHLMLERWAEAQLAARPRGDSRDAVVANLQALLAAYGIGPQRLIAAHAMKHLIAAALTRVINE
jgi:uncharacterized protein (TIGR02444 family)